MQTQGRSRSSKISFSQPPAITGKSRLTCFEFKNKEPYLCQTHAQIHYVYKLAFRLYLILISPWFCFRNSVCKAIMTKFSLKMAAKQPIISAEDLKEVLECPVCLRIPRSAPVFQCERGHVVCNECHPKLSRCPVCRLPLGKTRSLISEKVLSR